jgi:hypothetical protein
MKAITVNVHYRTASGCNCKTVTVDAETLAQAIEIAAAKVRRMRGVIEIANGVEWPQPEN